jgi:hypothetical protein
MNALDFLSLYRIRHRMPGRIRLHVPALENLERGWHSLTAPVRDLITIKQGIRDVKLDPRSGSVLLEYNPDLISEKEVLQWLRRLVRHFKDLAPCGKRLSREESRDALCLLKNRLGSIRP